MIRPLFRMCRALPVSAVLAAATLPSPAPAFDCSFFEAQASDKDETDYSVRMAEACRALADYRARLVAENVRYAYGDAAVADDPRANAERGRYLDTFHVLSDMQRYALAREAGVFAVISELP